MHSVTKKIFGGVFISAAVVGGAFFFWNLRMMKNELSLMAFSFAENVQRRANDVAEFNQKENFLCFVSSTDGARYIQKDLVIFANDGLANYIRYVKGDKEEVFFTSQRGAFMELENSKLRYVDEDGVKGEEASEEDRTALDQMVVNFSNLPIKEEYVSKATAITPEMEWFRYKYKDSADGIVSKEIFRYHLFRMIKIKDKEGKIKEILHKIESEEGPKYTIAIKERAGMKPKFYSTQKKELALSSSFAITDEMKPISTSAAYNKIKKARHGLKKTLCKVVNQYTLKVK